MQKVTTKRNPVTPAARTETNLPGWVDWTILAIVLIVSIASIILTLNAGVFNASLLADSLWSWHLVRAAGMVAYMLLAASTIWGLFLSSRIIKDWAPGPMSLLLHASVSWLSLVFALAHIGLLLFDNFYKYTLADLFIPFIGPYRPVAVGLGVIAFWLTLAITISFSLKKLIGHRNWLLLHYTSYGAFVLITIHALFAGTDATQIGMKAVTLGSTAITMVLLAWRIRLSMITRRAKLAKQNAKNAT